MSDTPRTDAEHNRINENESGSLCADLIEALDFARRLERELADMTADRDSWCEQNDHRVTDALNFSKQSDAWREVAKRLADRLEANKRHTEVVHGHHCVIGTSEAIAAFDKLNTGKTP